jgi:DNA-binding beta-propeller fold protein YncE
MKLLAIVCFAGIVSAQPFKLVTTIPLPGVEGRFDHMAVDLAAKHLVVAALGNNTVEVIDVASGKRLQTWSGMKEPQGIAYAADIKRIYVASGKDGKLRIYDSVTLKPVSEVAVGEDADNVRYEAAHKRVWVAHGDGAIAEVDAATGRKLGEISLDAHPESFQFEKSGVRIFANVPGASEIEVIDRDRKTIVAKWPVKEAEANYPMAFDEANHRLFAGCRKPARVLVLNSDTGKVTAQIPCPGDTDDLFYDAARKRLYVAGGEGFLEAFDQKGPDDYRSVGKVATAAGARTGLYVPELSRFFLAAPHRGGAQQAEIRVYAVE